MAADKNASAQELLAYVSAMEKTSALASTAVGDRRVHLHDLYLFAERKALELVRTEMANPAPTK